MRNLTLVFAVCLPVISCSQASQGSGAPAGGRGAGRGPAAAVPVVTARVEQKAMPVALPAVGAVEAIASAQLRALVTGQLSAVHFAEGQDVEAGQPLFSLDRRPFDAALQQAQAVLERDTATLQNAQAQQSRSATLFQRGLIPRDQNETQAATVGALVGTIAADKAAIETAKLNLQFTEIKAPISGRTGSLGAHVGDLVRANDTTILVVINQLSPVYVTFSVPGRYLADIRRFQAVRPLSVTAVVPAGLAGSAAPAAAIGTVSFIDNMVDATTGSIRMKATFPNTSRQLWPGIFVNVALDLTTESNALVVPATAVQASQEGQYVYVVKADRTVELRTVVVARQVGDEAVVASGVSKGDIVVTDGQLRLTPGAPISERGAGGPGRSGR